VRLQRDEVLGEAARLCAGRDAARIFLSRLGDDAYRELARGLWIELHARVEAGAPPTKATKATKATIAGVREALVRVLAPELTAKDLRGLVEVLAPARVDQLLRAVARLRRRPAAAALLAVRRAERAPRAQ
jgi:hypothetical protein